MRFRFTIGKKLIVGFGILLISMLAYGLVTYQYLQKSIELNKKTSEVITPSISKLKDLEIMVTKSKNLMTSWLTDESDEVLNELENLHENFSEDVNPSFSILITKWDDLDRAFMEKVLRQVQELFNWQKKQIAKYGTQNNGSTEYEIDLLLEKEVVKNDQDGSRGKRIGIIQKNIKEAIIEKEEEAVKSSEDINSSFKFLQRTIVVLLIILMVMGSIIAIATIRSIVRPIRQLKNILLEMGHGVLPQQKIPERSDEIGEMSNALESLVNGLKSTSNFAREIGEGNFKSNFNPMSEEDILGNSLILMRDNLESASEEDKKRSWLSEGLAKFGELLRANSNDLEKLTKNLLNELVEYLGANQGCIFVLDGEDDTEPYLDLKACYAWDRFKYYEEKVTYGDGLVGQVWQEEATIYITDIPDNYIKITSGLGEAEPRAVLLVPMLVNGKVFGVVELASFNEFTKVQIEFVEKLAESTGMTISNVKINEKTRLLLEQSQRTSEQMRVQEEELRQNQEEMLATQEEIQRSLQEHQEKLEEAERENLLLKKELHDLKSGH